MKSRGVYETPGGTILLAAHRAMESITLDRGAAHLKDDLMPRYAEMIYNGFWFSPEREMLQALIDKSQEFVAGTVRLKLYKGNVMVIGRSSPYSLYSQDLVTFEDDQGAYDQKDAQGFIKLNALRLRTLAMRKRKAQKKWFFINPMAHPKKPGPPAPIWRGCSRTAWRGVHRWVSCQASASRRPGFFSGKCSRKSRPEKSFCWPRVRAARSSAPCSSASTPCRTSRTAPT